jgi:hypothetical protein
VSSSSSFVYVFRTTDVDGVVADLKSRGHEPKREQHRAGPVHFSIALMENALLEIYPSSRTDHRCDRCEKAKATAKDDAKPITICRKCMADLLTRDSC